MMKNIRWTLLLGLLMATLTCLQAQVPDLDEKYAAELLKPGTSAPDFKLQTPDGKTIQFSDFAKGKYVVIDFWASWCPDCRKDMPEVIRMYNKWHKMGVEFLGVSFDTDKQKWTDYIAQSGVPYTQVSEMKRMNQSEVAKAYGVRWIPSLYLIGPDGKVLVSTVLSYKIECELATSFNNDKLGTTHDYMLRSIDGSKGKLSARLYQPDLNPGERCDLVIMCHGLNADKNFPLLTELADQLHRQGIATLEFDFNGHGKSEGRFSEMTIPNEIEDLEQVLAYAQDLRFVDDIALVGHSQGAVVAAMVAGKHPEDIKAVVLLAPASSVRDDVVRGNLFGIDFDPLDLPDSLALNNGITLGYRYLKTASTLPIFETAANYHGNACIIHGNADRLVPYTCSEHFHQTWTNSEYHLLNYYDHNFSVCPYRPAEITVEYLERVLRQP
ncbi:MAG: alpha/beta fold hydrolase [Bacteroidales bacterium]|nr:alpha/beta fold hydrolase [Bacteroidales bacterium]